MSFKMVHSIVLIAATLSGVMLMERVAGGSGPVGQYYYPYEKIEAEDFSYTNRSVVYVGCTEGAICDGDPEKTCVYVGDNEAESVIGYSGVDFGSGPGAKMITIRLSCYRDDDQLGNIFVHVDSVGDRPFATIPVRRTGDHCQFFTFSTFFSYVLTGIRNLYFTFDKENPAATYSNLDIDWFLFNETVTLN